MQKLQQFPLRHHQLTHQMDNTRAPSRNTHLRDRTLWFDGVSSFDPNRLLDVVQKYDVQFVDYLNDDVKEYNRFSKKEHNLQVKSECGPLNSDWVLPPEYAQLDVLTYLLDRHDMIVAGMDSDEIASRDIRLTQEIVRYQERGLFSVLKTIIYIINRLTAKGIVWGVGRGSSVSSYILFVIGAHDVDSYAYELDINDFLHE
jgi:DNA-dependent RNA polymerase auxiliary subunit epsilon